MSEAATEAEAAIKIEPPVGAALAWAYITLGQVAMAAGKPADAVQHLRRALVEAEEAPAQFASREALVQAERAANMTAAGRRVCARFHRATRHGHKRPVFR